MFIYLAAAVAILSLAACSSGDQKTAAEKSSGAATAAAPFTMQALKEATSGQFQPVPLPDPKIPGYKFPEKEDVIVSWTKDNNHKAITDHGWGIWTSLMADSGEVFEGQKLRVFETWYDPSDLMPPAAGGAVTAVQKKVRQPRRLRFRHRDWSALGPPVALS